MPWLPRDGAGYRKISTRFLDKPEGFKLAFAKAWYRLVHRDMGPRSRYLGPDLPDAHLLWQDSLPEVDCKTIGERHSPG